MKTDRCLISGNCILSREQYVPVRVCVGVEIPEKNFSREQNVPVRACVGIVFRETVFIWVMVCSPINIFTGG